MNSIIAKPSVQGLSRHMQRENKKGDPILDSVTISPRQNDLLKVPGGIRTGINFIEK